MFKQITRICTTILSLLVYVFFCSNSVFAIAKFNTSYQVYYKVDPTGITHVTFVISQKNNLSVVYATEFGISLNETRISNLKIKDEGVIVEPSLTKNQNQTIISFPFSQKIVGKEKVHNFTIEYDTTDIVSKQGNTWQINIPRFETDENVSDQTAILNLPSNFPPPAYIDPKPDIINGTNYYFSSKVLANKPISAIFGKNQYYKGKINYYLENTSGLNTESSITLLPNTSYQDVYYQSIVPSPIRTEIDPDGNLLAFYKLKPNQELNIKADLIVKTDFKSGQMDSNRIFAYTEDTNIWNYQNNIFTIPELENLTSPKSIYDYVSNKLQYDYQKINRDGTIRVSASESLKNFQTAICTDYTDLFVALARKAKIPARELEGLAISENPDLKPISSEKDVLHAWPEYFNEEKNQWIQVDPTWGSTTRGLDYFNKLDFNHLVFAIHGVDPLQPLPAGSFKKNGSKEKDLEFTAIEAVEFPPNNIEIVNTNSDINKTSFLIKNLNGIYLRGKISVSESPVTHQLSENINIPPWGEKKVILSNKLNTVLFKKSSEVIIDINGRLYSIQVDSGTFFQKAVILASGGLFLGIITLFFRGLLLRRRK